jgi:lipid-A-disaccharide synthase
MHLFLSAGEPSGDLHGANLIRELTLRTPNARIAGFGGNKMAAAGAQLLHPLANLAVMGFTRVLMNARTFTRLLNQAEDYFRTERPDGVVLIDYAGFNWRIAQRARKHGIPVHFFIAPQMWAWAGWRIKLVRERINTVFTTLPFEDAWYRERGVETHYLGHPYYDEIAAQKLDTTFLAQQQQLKTPIVGILPGSRNQEVSKNFPMMVNAAKRIQKERPDVRLLVASFNEVQMQMAKEMAQSADLPLEFHIGRTPEIIELSSTCMAVSGSVGLELMCRATPTVVIYKIAELLRLIGRWYMTVPHISLVNLLAGKELFPEFLTSRDRSKEIAGHILGWLNDESSRQEVVNQLVALRTKHAHTGACSRAAEFLVRTHASPEIHRSRTAA